MEIVKYLIRKKEMTASVMCIGAERRGAPYANAQYWGRYRRYGRCIGAWIKCELRVAKLRVGILRVEVRAKRASI